MVFKLTIGDTKAKKSIKQELSEDESKSLEGLKIGDVFKGELINHTGYEFKITGGSDKSGFPMRKGIPGARRKKILIKKSLGFRAKKDNKLKGIRKRKNVCGDTLHNKISQVNIVVTKYGSEPLIKEKKSEEEPKK